MYRCNGYRTQQSAGAKGASMLDDPNLKTLNVLRGIEEEEQKAVKPKSTRKRGRQSSSVVVSSTVVTSSTSQCSVTPSCPIHCPVVCHGCSSHCPPPMPTPTPPSPTQPVGKVRLPSAYLGDNLFLHAIDRGNGFTELTCIIPPISSSSDVESKKLQPLVLKVVDAQKIPGGFDPNIIYTPGQAASWPPMLVYKDECVRQQMVLALLRKKPNPTPMEQQQVRQALIALSAIDAHFLTWQYIQFLREFADMNTVTNDNVNFLVSVVNIPNLDNAFFVQYMAFGNGKDLFQPFATVDCVGHELSHGFCQRVCGLVYKGHAGALNESMADIVAFFFERWLYLKFNGDADQTNDIAGQWDFLIGEDNGRQFRYMRNLRNPKDCQIPQPDTFQGEFWKNPNNEQDDFGGVHANSGVANRLACLIMEAIGFNLAGKVLVAAWRKLKPLSNYLHYRDALKQVASEMNCLAQVQTCLNNVGLTDGAINDWNPK